MSYKGIDVSEHNGKIDWSTTAKYIDFAMIRAGYGKNNLDKYGEYNICSCLNNKIPFGLYWFSYATDLEMVIKEADYVCNIADKYGPTYPICFDWEYQSDNFAIKQGVNMTNNLRKNFAKAFLNRVEERGYYAMIYCNPDYLDKGFKDLTSRYDLWLANWGVSSPSVSCGIWQYSEKGKVNGINGNVDMDTSYKDYTKYCTKKVYELSKSNALKELDTVLKKLKGFDCTYEASKHFIDIMLK